MELKDILKEEGIVGVISQYEFSLDLNKKVSSIEIKNRDKAFQMVNLPNNIKEKYLQDLTLSELFKIDLISKLDEEIIIIGNISGCLNFKEAEFIKKLLLKLVTVYHKKIIVIDSSVQTFFNLVKKIVVINGKNILYETDNFYDDDLYKYAKIPKIIEFVKFVNQDKKRINKTTDIHELIKDIYRSVS